MKRKVFLKVKSVIKYILIFALLIASYNALLYSVCKIPSSMLKATAEKSAEILRGQGTNYSFSFYAHNDNEIDALMVNNAYSIDSEKPFDSFMWIRKNFNLELTKVIDEELSKELVTYDKTDQVTETYDTTNELYDFMDGKITHSTTNQVFWHGYLVFLRLWLLVFNITELRVARLLILGFVIIKFLKLLKKDFGMKVMFSALAVIILYEVYSVAASLVSFPVILVTLLFSMFLLKKVGKKGQAIHFERLFKYFFIVGSLIGFIDFFSIPLMSLGVPLLLVLMKYNKTQQKNNAVINAKKSVKFVGGTTLIWLAGYILTMITKWAMFMIYTNQFDLGTLFTQLGIRIMRSIENVNIGYNFIYIFVLALVVAGLSLVVATLKYKKLKPLKDIINDNLAIFIVGLLPVLWALVFFNHSVVNCFVVYRISIITAIASQMISTNMFKMRKK